MAINDFIKNARALSGGAQRAAKNAPAQYRDRKKQYLSDETTLFTQRQAQYSSDYFEARVQGLDPTDFYAWQTQLIRMADVVNPTATGTKTIDNLKQVLFANPAIDYIPRGAKIETMGSTWLVTNPLNISAHNATTLVEQCNAAWRHLDWYGNVLTEPLVSAKTLASASSNDKQEFTLITDGYFDFKAQLNEHTQKLKQNSRIILGSAAYALRGVTDFIQEFTGDDSSIHMLEFTGSYAEPNETDDMRSKVAGGLAFSWDISVAGADTIGAGETHQFTAESYRNGEHVTGTPEQPIDYIWTTTDENVATVDAQGAVTGVSDGAAWIYATLAQNPAVTQSKAVTVTGAGARIGFIVTPPTSLGAYESRTISAAYFVNGVAQPDIIEWTFSGAHESCYSADVSGNSATITCWKASTIPLSVDIWYNGSSETAMIKLIGL